MKKRILGIITAMAMLLPTMPRVIVNAEENITISTAAELKAFADSVNNGNTYEGKTVTLTADIDLSEICGEDIDGAEISWTPVGADAPFNGTFNGNGHTISGLYINSENGSFTGLFGFCDESSQILNLIVDGSVKFGYPSFEGGWANPPIEIGGIAGASAGKIANCHNKAAISGLGNGAYAAGICGMGLSVVIENCINTGVITSEYKSEAMVAFGTGYDNDNCYYLEGTSVDGSGAQAKTAKQFASGEVTYLLNGGSKEWDTVWYQTIGEDEYPTLDSTHKVVLSYYGGCKFYNNDLIVDGKVNARVVSRFNYTSETPLKITSQEELKALVKEGDTYADWIERSYPESFFEDKFVYLRYVQRANDMADYEVTDVKGTDSSLDIEVTRVATGNGDMSQNFCLLVDADKSFLDKDFNITFKRCLYTVEYFEGKPEDDTEENCRIINTLDELQQCWDNAEVTEAYGKTDFDKYSLIVVSWDEPQAVRATAVTDVALSDTGNTVTLSRCFPDGEVFPDLITSYSAVILAPKTLAQNGASAVFKEFDAENANDIAIKFTSSNNLFGHEIVVSVENLSEKATLIGVGYDEYGNILDVTTKQINTDGEHSLLIYNTRHTTDKVSVFLWDSVNGMRPLGAIKEQPLRI